MLTVAIWPGRRSTGSPKPAATSVDDGSRIEHDPADGAVALAIKLRGTIKDQPDHTLRSGAGR